MMINHIITSSLVTVFVLLIGTIFENKISACMKYSLWLLVAVKLLLPNPGMETKFHVMNCIGNFIEVTKDRVEMLAEYKPDFLLDEIMVTEDKNREQSDDIISHDFENNLHTETNGNHKPETIIEGEIVEKTNRTTTVLAVIKGVYLVGVFGTLSVIIISNLLFSQGFKKKRKYIKLYEGKIPVYKVEDYYGACLYGGVSPIIIVGNNHNLTIEQQHMIMLHEYVHYIHGDHIWAIVRSLCISLYWYNPLVWLAASVSRKDGEVACDEGTLKRIDKKQRLAYGQALLEIVAKTSECNKFLSAAFLNSTAVTNGKAEMKKRITMITKRRKTNKLFFILTIMLSVACIGCTLGQPMEEVAVLERDENDLLDSKITMAEVIVEDEQLISAEMTAISSNTIENNIIQEEQKYVWPTVSTTISNGFGERIHPITGERKIIDYMGIAGNQGDSIYAVTDGDIIDVGFDNTLGNYIVLATATGEEVTYGHLDGSKVSVGAQVKAGDIIGVLGKTGNATGPFLSISVKVTGEKVDPKPYFNTDFFEEIMTHNGREYKKTN